MDEQVKEITGFFCRWLLLGGVVCSIFVLARASLATAREIPAHGGIHLVVSDEMHRGLGLGEMLMVNAYLCPPGWTRTKFQFIAAPHGGRPIRVLSYGSRIVARLPLTSHGLNSLEFKGHPYGSFAFERSGGIYRTISPGGKVFAIEASLAANSSKQELQECLGVLRSLGDVVFIAETDLDEYTRIRPILRREFPDIPQICKVRAPHWKRGASFDKLQHDLKARRWAKSDSSCPAGVSIQ